MTRFIASTLLVLGTTFTGVVSLPAPARASCSGLGTTCLRTVRFVDGLPLLTDILKCEYIYYTCLVRMM